MDQARPRPPGGGRGSRVRALGPPGRRGSSWGPWQQAKSVAPTLSWTEGRLISGALCRPFGARATPNSVHGGWGCLLFLKNSWSFFSCVTFYFNDCNVLVSGSSSTPCYLRVIASVINLLDHKTSFFEDNLFSLKNILKTVVHSCLRSIIIVYLNYPVNFNIKKE